MPAYKIYHKRAWAFGPAYFDSVKLFKNPSGYKPFIFPHGISSVLICMFVEFVDRFSFISFATIINENINIS